MTVFVVCVLKDMLETCDMWTDLSFFRYSESTELFTASRFKDNGAEVATECQEITGYADKHVRVVQPTSDVSLLCRSAIIMAVIVPKAAMAVFVRIAGSSAILRAGNEFDLVLNSVAAVFLLEIDDVAYKVFVPTAIQKKAGSAPVFGFSAKQMEESKLRWVRRWSPVLLLLCTAAVDTFLIFAYWCTPHAPGTPFYSGGGGPGRVLIAAPGVQREKRARVWTRRIWRDDRRDISPPFPFSSFAFFVKKHRSLWLQVLREGYLLSQFGL